MPVVVRPKKIVSAPARANHNHNCQQNRGGWVVYSLTFLLLVSVSTNYRHALHCAGDLQQQQQKHAQQQQQQQQQQQVSRGLDWFLPQIISSTAIQQSSAASAAAAAASKNQQRPFVSVILPVHKADRLEPFRQAVKSVLNNQYTYHGRIEIIVINIIPDVEMNHLSKGQDLFQNRTVGRVPIWVLRDARPSEGKFAGYARNLGIHHAQGDYVAFLDSDDAWLPNKLERQFAAAELYGTLDLFGSEAYIGRSGECRESSTGVFTPWDLEHPEVTLRNEPRPLYNGGVFRNALGGLQESPIRDGTFLPAIWDYSFMKWHNCAITSTVVVRRSLILRVGGFAEREFHQEDWLLWQKLLQENTTSLGDISDKFEKPVIMGYFAQPTIIYDMCHGGPKK